LKKSVIPQNEAGHSYISGDKPFYSSDYPYLASVNINMLNELHTGAGGCGKTHSNLIFPNNVAVCYLAPSWKLSKSKNTEFNGQIFCSVWKRLLSKCPQKWQFIRDRFSVLIIDEISMMRQEDLTKIME
jgi:hypothetical protein